jgi:hypothetical protein
MVSQATDDDVEYDMEGGRTATATATASSAIAIHDKTDDAVVSNADFDNFLQFVNDEIDSPVPLTRVVVEGKGGPSSSPPRPHRPLYFLFFVAPFATRNDGQTSSPTRSTRAHRLSNAPPPTDTIVRLVVASKNRAAAIQGQCSARLAIFRWAPFRQPKEGDQT